MHILFFHSSGSDYPLLHHFLLHSTLFCSTHLYKILHKTWVFQRQRLYSSWLILTIRTYCPLVPTLYTSMNSIKSDRVGRVRKGFFAYQIFFCNVSLQGLYLVHCWITAFHSDKFYISARAIACHQKSVLYVKHLFCTHEAPLPVFISFTLQISPNLLHKVFLGKKCS